MSVQTLLAMPPLVPGGAVIDVCLRAVRGSARREHRLISLIEGVDHLDRPLPWRTNVPFMISVRALSQADLPRVRFKQGVQ
ncbi:MAG: hypothetical protein V4460_12590 [Pseudomonadota bacterium]|jgi:hypothetical protein